MATVKQDGTGWTITADAVTVRVDSNTLGFSMQRTGGRAWNMLSDADSESSIPTASCHGATTEAHQNGEPTGLERETAAPPTLGKESTTRVPCSGYSR